MEIQKTAKGVVQWATELSAIVKLIAAAVPILAGLAGTVVYAETNYTKAADLEQHEQDNERKLAQVYMDSQEMMLETRIDIVKYQIERLNRKALSGRPLDIVDTLDLEELAKHREQLNSRLQKLREQQGRF